jgi:hypothetical protein
MGYTFKNGISEPDEEHIIRMEKRKEVKVLGKSFKPFEARIIRLHLCAFWPTREIETVQLK